MKANFKRIPIILAMASIGALSAPSMASDWGMQPKHIILRNGMVLDIPAGGDTCRFDFNICLGGWDKNGNFPGIPLIQHMLKAVAPGPRPADCERKLTSGSPPEPCTED